MGSSGDGMAGLRNTETDADEIGMRPGEVVDGDVGGLRCLREKAAMCESGVLRGRAAVSMDVCREQSRRRRRRSRQTTRHVNGVLSNSKEPHRAEAFRARRLSFPRHLLQTF